MNLRDRLQRAIGEPDRSPDLRGRLDDIFGARDSRDRATGLLEVLGGEIIEAGEGPSVIVRNEFLEDHVHGNIPLSDLFDIGAHLFPILGRSKELEDLDVEELLFLDTETTGLSGGAGTCAFLVGTAFFKNRRLQVHQFFMRDFDEESSMLSSFKELAEVCRAVVTYNGKSFDIPLLDERFILKRNRMELRKLPHIDLLIPARRLFQGLFEDCRLSTLEGRILGVERIDDIPGPLIPQVFFDFLRTGSTVMLERIFYHNRMDLISLVALTSRVAALIDDPFQASGKGLVKLGKFHHDHGDPGIGSACIETALEGSLSHDDKAGAAKILTLRYKREGRHEEAACIWEKMISEGCDSDPFPYLELAKYYEHRRGDPLMALSMADRILHMEGSNRTALEHRIARLKRKLGK